MFSYFKSKHQEKTQSATNNQGMLRLPSNIISQLVTQNITHSSKPITEKKLHISQPTNNELTGTIQKKEEQKSNNKLNSVKSDSIIDTYHITNTSHNKTPSINQNENNGQTTTAKSQQLLQNVNTITDNDKLSLYQQQKQQQKQLLVSKQKSLQIQHSQQFAGQQRVDGGQIVVQPSYVISQVMAQAKTAAFSSQLSNLSNQDLYQLTSSIIDILTQTISQQLLGTIISPQQTLSLHKCLKPSTISTITQLKSHHYQQFLLQTKQKYNQLVDQSTNLFSKSKQIADYIHQFLLSINLFFQSQELLVPVQEIHKGICQLNPAKTQKYINYLIKIFQSNFDQVIEKKTQIIKSSLQTQLRRIQKQNKQLENQIKKLNEQFKAKENIYLSSESRVDERQSLISNLKKQIQQLNNKLSQISSINKQSKQDFNSQLLLLKRQLQRNKKQSQQQHQKLNKLQKTIQKREKLIKTKQQQITKLQLAIKQLKQTQNQGVQKIVQQIEMKEKAFNTKIEQFSIEKINFQTKIRSLSVQNASIRETNSKLQTQCTELKNQVQKLKNELVEIEKIKNSSQQNVDQNNISHQESDHITQAQQQQQQSYQNQNNQVDLSKLVNKQIMAHLFLSFEDESKQWAIRNNIKNQIYILLNIKQNNKSLSKAVHQNQLQKQPSTKKVIQEPSIIGKWLGW